MKIHKNKKILFYLLAVLNIYMVGFSNLVYATTFITPTNAVKPYTLELQATVSTSPLSITIEWPKENGVTDYSVYRKLKNDTNWGSVLATIPFNGSATTYTYIDTNITLGVGYEYQVIKNMPSAPLYAYGYIYAGVELPLLESRGKVILIIDSTLAPSLTTEIAQLKADLAGDGWTVISHTVARTDSVPSVKALIKSDYDADPTNVKSVFLLGRIPVPYAGQMNPDGHSNHLGAWPADVYYGEMNSEWTDVETWPNSSSLRQTNIAGDGKFDQSDPPSEVELGVGRIDLYNMTAFAPLTELDLVRQYLTKDHQYKHKIIAPVSRAIMQDGFANSTGEAFSLGGWRNFSDLVGSSNITTTANYFNTLATNSYLWTHANGSGTYTSISGFGTTSSFAANAPKSVFNLLFGSYLGDWDTTNNILRAPLASAGWGLASVWFGRPQWHLYHMALGETIGYSTKLTQYNTLLYKSLESVKDYDSGTHAALMGDPTLRNNVVAPISGLSVTNPSSNTVTISWTASPDSGLSGYHVYRSTTEYGNYTRITTNPVVGTTYTDTAPSTGGTYFYMVRAVKLETTPSGTYFNQSQGISGSVVTPTVNQAPVISGLPGSDGVLLPNTLTETAIVSDDNLPTADPLILEWTKVSGPGTVDFSSTTTASTTMGFSSEGEYVVQLSASDGALTSTAQIIVTASNDSTPPSTPTALASSNISETSATLSWPDSTDNIGVTGYIIYRNGSQVGTSSTSTYVDIGLSSGSTYSYRVTAYDATHNMSAMSDPVSITTTSPSSSGGGGGSYNPNDNEWLVYQPPVELTTSETTDTIKKDEVVKEKEDISVGPTVETVPQNFNFTKTLKQGMTGDEVLQLQKYLNTKGFVIALTGPGSRGSETNIFASNVKSAVSRLQKVYKIKYDKKIKVDGIVGPQMRKYLNDPKI